ncbi:MAG: (2E,6E)-farnesyl diphosphate synthase [Gammaproteobacteria bacterium]|nr:(2E,6E)-farnesyl diphosphate synthase [Gammaproteobacteria bacterium]
MNPQLQPLLDYYAQQVDQTLERHLPDPKIHPSSLHQAMRYSVFNGGKRIRPLLVYLSGRALGVTEERLHRPACAVELIHAYSLIHDDLPAMDDDDLRRGRATCHIKYNEATAILAGDALQTLAFQILAGEYGDSSDAAINMRMLQTLTHAAGSRGMVGGQAIDLEATGKQINATELENMHIHKTGALIRASVLLGALCQPQEADESIIKSLDHYAKCIGLSFQIQDDILDEEGDTQVLGKTVGSDHALNKATYPALLGLGEARKQALELHQEAINSLQELDQRADPLRWLSAHIIERDH